MIYHISSTKGYFRGKGNLIFQAQTFDWALSMRDNSLLDKGKLSGGEGGI